MPSLKIEVTPHHYKKKEQEQEILFRPINENSTNTCRHLQNPCIKGKINPSFINELAENI
jgi:hypothetical protein